MVLRVGLTGGIATGKTQVEAMLRRLGVPVIDADAVVHDLLRHDAGLKAAIRDAFGPEVMTPSGEVDRRALGLKVFSDPERRRLLESWTHPKVRAEIEAFFQANQDESIAVASIPLLYESGLQAQYDQVWLVYATPAQQRLRLREGRGLSLVEITDRMASQYAIDEKRGWADVVIENAGDLSETEAQVVHWVDRARQLSAKRG